MMPIRGLLLWTHRTLGLAMAGFLFVAALTGAVLAFSAPIQNLVDPPVQLPERVGPLLDPLTLRDLAQEKLGTNVLLTEVLFVQDRNRPYSLVVLPRPDATTGKAAQLDYLYIEMDPVTGQELRRFLPEDHGLWLVTRKNLLGFLFNLHRGLLLPGKVGTRLMGAIAVLWVIDCLVALALTMPDWTGSRRRGWWARWWNPSWLVRWGGPAHRTERDVHRASGLWVWLALLGMAVSAVAVGLREEVFMPLLHRTLGMSTPAFEIPRLKVPRDAPRLDWRAARERGRELMASFAQERGFTIRPEGEFWISYDRDTGTYAYDVCTSCDHLDEGCGTILAFDGDTGEPVAFQSLTGFKAGNSLSFWLSALHMGVVGGIAYKTFLAILGIVIAVLAATGVRLWWYRRRARAVFSKAA